MWWLLIPAVLIIFVAILLIRTAKFRPVAEHPAQVMPVTVDQDKAVENLREMIRCKTVSNSNPDLIDEAEFERFRELLPRLYPNIHRVCERERIGLSGLLYHWKGKSSENPTILMAHYDVVPANEEDWEKPAFEGILEDGVLWGRGTLDTKGTLCGVLEGAENLISQDFTPQNDIYFAFVGDEEVNGSSAPSIVAELEKRGIQPALIVDEGGAVVEGVFPGVTQPCALIGIAEKGMLNVELSMKSRGGHASSPPPHTPVGVLAKAVVEIENKPFPAQLTKPAAEMFDTLGRHSSFLFRLIFSNLWCFRPVLDSICRKSGGELNALMRTTCAFTMMQGSKAPNVLPPLATVSANLRLIGDETTDSAVEYLRKAANNPDITISKVYGMNPSIYSETEGEGWERVKNAISQTWPEALISPYLMVACSDSRHYCRISNHVYRFSAMALSKEERSEIHGNNERIPVEKIATTAAFYMRLIKRS